MKKVLSIIMAILMVASVLPITSIGAIAATNDATFETPTQSSEECSSSVDDSIVPTVSPNDSDEQSDLQSGGTNVTLHAWFSDSEFGDVPDRFIARNRVYLCYELIETATGKKINSVIDIDYTATLTLYRPDGTVAHTYEVDNDDQSWISVIPYEAGIYTGVVQVTGDVGITVNVAFELEYDASLSSSLSSYSLNLNGTNSKTSTITVSGGYPGDYGIRYSIKDSSIASASWGGWNGSSNTLTVTGKKLGSTTVDVSLYEGYTGNKNIVKTITIPITVTANSYTVSFNANGGSVSPTSKTVTYSSTYGSLPTPTRSGYSFVGWYTASSGGSWVSSSTTVTTTANHTLYAHWTKNSYNLTYNPNGGSEGVVTYSGATTYTIKSEIPTRFGYTFLGWSKSSSATTATYQPGDSITLTQSTTLYAVWKQTSLYNASSDTANIAYGGQLYYFKFTPSTSGTYVIYSTSDKDTRVYLYNSSGTELSTNDDGGENYNFRLSYNLTAGNTYYYAVRFYNSSQTGSIPIKFGPVYRISYNANGGSGAPSSQSKDYGSDITLSSVDPTRDGYNFLGWSTSSTASSATYESGDSFSVNANTTLYAVWEPISYSVSFDANGGTGGPGQQIKIYGQPLTLPTTKPTRFGYTFLGWSTSSTATSATYQPGGSYTLNASARLYAVWRNDVVSLSSGSTVSADITSGGAVKYYSFTPTSSGAYVIYSTGSYDTKVALYNVNGTEITNNDDGGENNNFRLQYNLSAGTEYIYGVRYYSSSNTGTISFKFGKVYTISYSANGGTGAPGSQSKDYGKTLTLSTTQPQKSGYTFLGWSTSSSATSATYQPGGSFTTNADTTLYAVWRSIPGTLSVNSSNSATISSSGEMKYYTFTPDSTGKYVIYSTGSGDTKVYLYDANGNELGYDDDSGDNYNFRLVYNMTAGTTYTFGVRYYSSSTGTISFKFGKVYTVSYNANGGTGAPGSQSKDYGKALTLSDTQPTRDGYTFLGWSTSSTSTTAMYQPGDDFTTNANTTLYAVWKSIPVVLSMNSTNSAVISSANEMKYYTFTPDSTGKYVIYSTGSSDTKVYLYDANGDELGYDDDGAGNYQFRLEYNMTAGTTYTFGVRYYGSSTGTISFKFGKVYTISYSANGGTGAPGSQSKDYGKALTLSNNQLTRDGYTFLGWSTSSTATTAMYQPGDDFTTNANTTLYAVWRQNVVLSSISVYNSPDKVGYYIGDSFDSTGLKIRLTYSDGSTQIVSSGFSISYQSFSTEGTKIVTVSYGGKSTNFTVSVCKPYITLSAASLSLYEGDTRKLTATTAPSAQSVTWTSSNTSVATVSNGTITAKTEGSTTITATFTYKGITYSETCTVIVTKPVHTHTQSSWIIDRAATCETNGSKHIECTSCGEVLETSVILATGHTSSGWITDRSATCSASGSKHKECTICGKTLETATIAKANHTVVKDEAISATCTTDGKTEGSHCSVCNTIINAQSIIPSTGHSVSSWIIDRQATCTVNGSKHKECTVCEEVIETVSIISIGHISSSWIIDRNSTCSVSGSKHKECTVCYATLETATIAKLSHTVVKDNAVAATCTTAGKTEGSHCSVCNTIIKAQTTIPSTGHSSSDWIIDRNATCSVSGSKHKECTVCDKTIETATIAKLSHTVVKDNAVAATCTTTGKTEGSHCSVCNTIIKAQTTVPATGHDSSSWIIDKNATCTANGSKHKECNVCGKATETATIAKLSHIVVKDNAVAATCTTAGKTEGSHCSVCKTIIKAQTTVAAKGHNASAWIIDRNATCMTSGSKHKECTACSVTLETATIAQTGHTVVKDNAVEPTCISEGKTEGSHCSVCNVVIVAQTEIPTIAHDLTDWIIDKETTCVENGSKHKNCTICGGIIETVAIEALGHISLRWIIDRSATCTRDGSKHSECNVCGVNVETIVIPATGHQSSNWIIDEKATVNTAGKKHKECEECGEITEKAKIPQLKPATPKLSKIENTASGVKVTWGKVSGADKYIVYRKTYDAKTKKWSGWSKLNSAVTSTSYVDKTAKTGKYYRYTIRATNEAGSGGFNKDGIKTYFLSVPKITSTANINSGVTVKWGKVSGASGYYVYRKTTGGWTKIATVKGNGTVSYTDKTAKAGVTYKYTVRAYYSSYLSSYNAKGADIRRLTTPSLKSVTSAKAGVTFKWNKVTGATSYIVYRKTGNGGWKKLATVKGNSQVSYLDKTAKKGVTYTYTVKACYSTSTSYYNTKGLTVKDKY